MEEEGKKARDEGELKKKMKKEEGEEKSERRSREARGRGDSASQLRLLLLLSRESAAEGFRPPVVVHPLGRLGVDDL